MQAVRLITLIGLAFGLAACGSSNNTSSGKKEKGQTELEAWYVLEVGGRQESGRSHYYRLKVSSLENCQPDSIYFEDLSLGFKSSQEESVWEAYRHFEPDEKVPGGVLSADISLRCSDEVYRVKADSIYLKESVILP